MNSIELNELNSYIYLPLRMALMVNKTKFVGTTTVASNAFIALFKHLMRRKRCSDTKLVLGSMLMMLVITMMITMIPMSYADDAMTLITMTDHDSER